MLLYLDCCFLCRPHDLRRENDELAAERMRLEAEALHFVLSRVRRGAWRLASSEALQDETSRIPNEEARKAVQRALSLAAVFIPTTDHVLERAEEYASAKIVGYDAIHLASAVEASADSFLTVDDRLCKRARGLIPSPLVRVEQPLVWLQRLGGRKLP